jgi:hypothetical protein
VAVLPTPVSLLPAPPPPLSRQVLHVPLVGGPSLRRVQNKSCGQALSVRSTPQEG